MTLAKRIVPCLDVDHGRVVKGINFVNLRSAGDPVELAQRYCEARADELVFLDITASPEKRKILERVVRDVAENINIPFTVGGGIRGEDDVRMVLCSGADKVSVNTAAVEEPRLIPRLSKIFGSQCVVVAIDAKRRYDSEGPVIVKTTEGDCWFEVYTYGGRKATGLDAILWAQKVSKLGAGELLVTSMDRDGTEKGYDLELTLTISEKVNIPVIASGGAGKPENFYDAFTIGKADAALAASVFHYDKFPIPLIKKYLVERGIEMRP
ncbi:MAG: imidazole glycerol phosphate synthase subunit HisF [Candidatus Methylarchaceae archaeon HK02M1]|nr:imidazole glycerol phosphate synthase subunit HisF [Candidatus Methylarchaceae archaeon HK02M1]